MIIIQKDFEEIQNVEVDLSKLVNFDTTPETEDITNLKDK